MIIGHPVFYPAAPHLRLQHPHSFCLKCSSSQSAHASVSSLLHTVSNFSWEAFPDLLTWPLYLLTLLFLGTHTTCGNYLTYGMTTVCCPNECKLLRDFSWPVQCSFLNPENRAWHTVGPQSLLVTYGMKKWVTWVLNILIIRILFSF